MRVKVFTIFHRALDERLLFDLLTAEEVAEFFTLYGVNDTHPQKLITKLDGTRCSTEAGNSHLILEYKLPWYDALLQARGFMETSCYVHLQKNRIHESFDYVGVAQYDMRWTENSVSILRGLVAKSPVTSSTAYGLHSGNITNARGHAHPFTFPKMCNWTYLLDSYNRFFKRTWDGTMLIDKPFTLWQTYLLPSNQFADLACWLASLCSEIYPWANQAPYPTHWGHLAGWTERAESIFIAARIAEGQITFEPLDLYHDRTIAKQLTVSRDHYGKAPNPS